MGSIKLGIVGDGGTTRVGGTSFYYNPGGGYTYKKPDDLNNNNVTSTGPAQDSVVELVRKANPDQFINLGDLVYNTGASTSYDENIGRIYNDFMSAYPSKYFTEGDYLKVGPTKATIGGKAWPFNIYNFPYGYPNPVSGAIGGSPDGINKFWPTIGNHEYYLRTSKQGDTNISLHTPGSKIPDKDIKGQSSTPVPQPFIDYFSWLKDPTLANNSSLKIGSADGSGNSGVYYKVSLGVDESNKPLIDVFSIDAMRLVMNRGGKYPQFTDGFGPNSDTYKSPENPTWNLRYDPSTKPTRQNRQIIKAANSSDPTNGWKQFQWLKNELTSSNAHWKIIIGHQPIYGSGSEDGQLDDNNNNPELQRFLNGLPKNSFDVYLNGHSHFYQRVLEQSSTGPAIGPGIPFISIGSSGRKQDDANPSLYGQSTYEHPTFKLSSKDRKEHYSGTDAFMRKKPSGNEYSSTAIKGWSFEGNDPLRSGEPYYNFGFRDYLLDSNPTTVGFSAGRSVGDQWEPSAYGFGFGGATLSATPDSLLFHYQTAEVADPAIAENLDANKRLAALSGWQGLTAKDWKPKNPTTGKESANYADTAVLELKLEAADNGQFKSVKVANNGFGYMETMSGSHVVDFAIRGNDPITGQSTNPLNPTDLAIVRLSFAGGKLADATLINNGSGYQNLGQLINSENSFYSTVEFNDESKRTAVRVPIHYSWTDVWYGTSASPYQDRYLIAQTAATARVVHDTLTNSVIEVQVLGKTAESRDKLNSIATPSEWTTGYSGIGQQRGYDRAQKGSIAIRDSKGKTLIEGASLDNGISRITLPEMPANRKIEVAFGGDPFSSYLVNFKPSSTLIEL
jgi:hypothetical protein